MYIQRFTKLGDCLQETPGVRVILYPEINDAHRGVTTQVVGDINYLELLITWT